MASTVGECFECRRPLQSGYSWAAGDRLEGHVRKGAQGLCHRDYMRRFGRQDPVSQAPTRKREEVLEEYLMIRDDVANVRQAAVRMGMSFAALDRALYRARLDGDRRAMPPSDQVSRAIARGQSYKIAA